MTRKNPQMTYYEISFQTHLNLTLVVMKNYAVCQELYEKKVYQ